MHNSRTPTLKQQQYISDTIHFIIYTSAFSVATCQNVSSGKELTDKLGGKGSDMHAGGLIRELETGAQWVWKSGNELEE